MTLAIRVTPNARTNTISGAETRDDGTIVLRVRVAAVPDKGRANKAVAKLLARHLGLPPSAVAITAGHTARLKILTISGDPVAISTVLDTLA